jgi:hypothetical protein
VAKKTKDKSKDKRDGGTEWPTISVSAHPRASRSIRRTKAWTGLIAFFLVGYVSHQAGVSDFEVGVRALIAGIFTYLVTWRLSVAFWQRLVLHEAKTEAERRRDEREAAMRRMMEAQNPSASGDDTEAVA